ncbi:MAG: hypothetical protein DI636_03275 [Pelagerythrobacter marensis]|uniref:hypothetical protein n=1 Tax=Qipengyuania sp. YIM B01966 TaxID=2778646 RepID=UPI000DB63C39|nr:hypothetical protein [Qipengyuania sp. YIM B01966]PZO71611.1 MAG: hypothetical protein DI636_03275 [Pelagerythrobacter marensis]PZU17716.1 MAG: hypothetical protein DI591_02725 [Citromicrobium sp.]
MRAFPIIAGLGVTLTLLACAPEQTAEQKAAADAADIAAVERAQQVPPEPINPQTIAFADIEKHDLFGASCAFVPETSGTDPVLLAMERAGWMKIKGEMIRFAPDAGSAALPLGARGRYTGAKYAFTLDIAEGEGRQSGSETTDFPARLVVSDERDQVAYEANGTAQCGS